METELATYEEKNEQMSMRQVISILLIIFGSCMELVLNLLYDSSLYPWYVSSYSTFHVLYDYRNVCTGNKLLLTFNKIITIQ